MGLKEVEEDKVVLPLKPVIRVATRKTIRKNRRTASKRKMHIRYVMKK